MKKISKIAILLFLFNGFVFAGEKASVNWGNLWKQSPIDVKSAYLRGYEDGSTDILLAIRCGRYRPVWWTDDNLCRNVSQAMDKEIRNRTAFYSVFHDYDYKVIIAQMDSLYDDPANTYVPMLSVLTVSLKKLHGDKDADELLKTYRNIK